MPTIDIRIKDKIAMRTGGEAFIVRDNSDYVINFTFDVEWAEETAKTARFALQHGGYMDVPFTGSSVAVPVISTGRRVDVGVFAGNLRTTTSATLPLVPSIRSKGGAPVPPEDAVYDKLIALINSMGEISDDDIKQAVEDYLSANPIAAASMRVDSGYIQYSTDDGKTWVNLIAEADLKGDKGADGKSAYAYAVQGGYTGTEAEFAEKLAEEIPAVDTTLTQSGKAAEAKAVGDAIRSLSEEIANLSGGLNSTAKSLLITILRDGIYNTNQSANITALSVALENTGGDNPSIPTESISIAGDTTVNSGKTLILTATLTPSNTTDSVVWTSSNETIATVTGSGSKNTVGTVTGIKGGTVTIRAIAGSISKTYTVTVVENVSLPDGYTALDYIVSNWKSSFDTGITADENTTAEYKISFIQLGTVHVLADNGAYAFPTSAAARKVRSKRGGTDYNYNYTLSTDTIYTIKAFGENSVNVNGTNIDTKSVVGNTPSGNGTLIFNNYGSVNEPYGAIAKYYYMKIWEGETLVRWYVPCKDINGTVGMYDAVGNTFNTKTVTGESFTEV